MKRAPSYSDSWLILNNSSNSAAEGLLTPILVPISQGSPNPAGFTIQEQEPLPQLQPNRSKRVLCFLFAFKGSFHILLISAFETLFYFLYVNKSENQGILATINTYYSPLVNQCQQTWGNGTRWFVRQLLAYEINQTAIDAAGDAAYKTRTAYNSYLLMWSSLYSVICGTVCLAATSYVWYKGWKIPWTRMLLENFMFVLLLGLYEVFFFRTIIYNYDTLSTAELNEYIVDGLAKCASP